MAEVTISQVMADAAEQAVAEARATHGVDLDYSPESVERVEQVLAAIYDAKPKGFMSRMLGRGLSQDEVARLARR